MTKTKANESDHTILLDWSVHDDDILVCFLVRKTGLIVGGWIKVVCVHCVWAHGQSGPMVVALERTMSAILLIQGYEEWIQFCTTKANLFPVGRAAIFI